MGHYTKSMSGIAKDQFDLHLNIINIDSLYSITAYISNTHKDEYITLDDIFTIIPRLTIGDNIYVSKSIETDLSFGSDLLIFTMNISDLVKNKSYKVTVDLDIKSTKNTKLIDNTSISGYLFTNDQVEVEPTISLVMSNYSYIVHCNTDFDFVEYKVNDNSWKSFDLPTFNLVLTDKVNYIQVRGKKDGNYYYSNVLKIVK